MLPVKCQRRLIWLDLYQSDIILMSRKALRMLKDKIVESSSGYLAIVAGLACEATGIALVISSVNGNEPLLLIPAVVALLLGGLVLSGLFMVNPNEARVLQLFGRYVGTTKNEGLRWASPFFLKSKVSLRQHSLETAKSKVNDVDGNPIEIAAVVVWRVRDAAQALFAVEEYPRFVATQAESAVRNLATHYPYDADHEDKPSLRGQTDVVAKRLAEEIATRVAAAGVDIVEARIAHLAYAPEIAQAMLQRQQAGAIIAARTKIVEGAVSMVEMALAQLTERGLILDNERKAQMVSNLLVVLCGERSTQPVINAGTIY